MKVEPLLSVRLVMAWCKNDLFVTACVFSSLLVGLRDGFMVCVCSLVASLVVLCEGVMEVTEGSEYGFGDVCVLYRVSKRFAIACGC